MSLVGGVVTRLGGEVTGIIGMWKSYRYFWIGGVMTDVLGVKKSGNFWSCAPQRPLKSSGKTTTFSWGIFLPGNL